MHNATPSGNDTPHLTDEHRAYLHENALTDEMIIHCGAHSGTRGELTGINFPYRFQGEEASDFMVDKKLLKPGGPPKYLWAAGVPLLLNEARVVPGAGPVLLIEGTKQALAVASWAPGAYSVYGMKGCYGWKTVDLSIFEGRDIFICLDGDASFNLNVYEAGQRLAVELDLCLAQSVKFIHLPVEGDDGADDYLRRTPEDKRTARIDMLVKRAKNKPADRKPTVRGKGGSEGDTSSLPDPGDGRAIIIVNEEQKIVRDAVLNAIKDKLNGKSLFDFGGKLARLRGNEAFILDTGNFYNSVMDTVACYTRKAGTGDKPDTYGPGELKSPVVQAVMSSADQFEELQRVVRAPFVRSDGSLCMKSGYDKDSKTFVVLDDDLGGLDIPENPTRQQACDAARFLTEEWFGDMPFDDKTDRANALALILTPFIRGLVPIVPMAIINGRQYSSGKGLFSECFLLMVTGEAMEPLPYVADEEEGRKQVTATFLGGGSIFAYDEAHTIDSAHLARTMTSSFYTDRKLGQSAMIKIKNQVTWLAMGNMVKVNGDMSRRMYMIRLWPNEANPQDRAPESYHHPDLRSWTRENRAALLSAALTIVRAWFVAGKPRGVRTKAMGSFEGWDRMMDGILTHAGVEGFLETMVEQRSENDFTSAHWTLHLTCLREMFGNDGFTTGDVRKRAIEPGFEPPPGMDDYNKPGWARNLGMAYARQASRWYTDDGVHIRLIRMGKAHRSVSKWMIEAQEEGGSRGLEFEPTEPSGDNPDSSDKDWVEPDVNGVNQDSSDKDWVEPDVNGVNPDSSDKDWVEPDVNGVNPANLMKSLDPPGDSGREWRDSVQPSSIEKTLSFDSKEIVNSVSVRIEQGVATSPTPSDSLQPLEIGAYPSISVRDQDETDSSPFWCSRCNWCTRRIPCRCP